MRKVLHFDSPRAKYHCDAAAVWCYDNRFELAFRKLLKRIGVVHADAIRVAGGAKCLATPDREAEREFVLEQIRKSMRLHGTDRVILMAPMGEELRPPTQPVRRPRRAITRTSCGARRHACGKPYRASPWCATTLTSKVFGQQTRSSR